MEEEGGEVEKGIVKWRKKGGRFGGEEELEGIGGRKAAGRAGNISGK